MTQDRWLLAGYAGVGGMFALERELRGNGTAASLAASGDDRNTTRDIGTAIAIAATAPPLLRLLPFGRLCPRRSPRSA